MIIELIVDKDAETEIKQIKENATKASSKTISKILC